MNKNPSSYTYILSQYVVEACGAVVSLSDCGVRGTRFDTQSGLVLSWQLIMKSHSYFSLPLIQEGQLSLTGESTGHLVLGIHLIEDLNLPRNSVFRLSDWSDVTIAVYHG